MRAIANAEIACWCRRHPNTLTALLDTEVREILDTAEMRERFVTQGIVAIGSAPEELAAIFGK